MLEIIDPSAAILQRDVEIGGVKYLLTARRLPSGWFGEWICCHCAKRGVNGVVYNTSSSALDMTAKNLGSHICREPE
jgi:hypothetical protein